MKRFYFTVFFVSSIFSFSMAQTDYYGSVGAGVDYYGDTPYFGPSGKYFFAEKHVGQAHVGYDADAIIVTALYSFHQEIIGKRGLRWYAGLGPSILLRQKSDNIFALRPHIGLDLKVKGMPIVLNLDWRPPLVLSFEGRTELIGFGLNVQYVIQ